MIQIKIKITYLVKKWFRKKFRKTVKMEKVRFGKTLHLLHMFIENDTSDERKYIV